MDLKMLNLAIGKLADDAEKMKEQMKEIFIQLSVLKNKKTESESPQFIVPSENEFITLQEVRKILKMSRNSVLQMVENGLIKPVRLTKRTIRYVKSDIQSIIKS